MKPSLVITIVCIIIVFTFDSCIKKQEKTILGKWKDESDMQDEKHTFEFFDNGKYIENSSGYINVGNYKINEKILYIIGIDTSSYNVLWLNNDKIVIENYTFNNNDLVLNRINLKIE